MDDIYTDRKESYVRIKMCGGRVSQPRLIDLANQSDLQIVTYQNKFGP